jgi:hypothetical protein
VTVVVPPAAGARVATAEADVVHATPAADAGLPRRSVTAAVSACVPPTGTRAVPGDTATAPTARVSMRNLIWSGAPCTTPTWPAGTDLRPCAFLATHRSANPSVTLPTATSRR